VRRLSRLSSTLTSTTVSTPNAHLTSALRQTIQALPIPHQELNALPTPLVLSLSGGLDSTALVHALLHPSVLQRVDNNIFKLSNVPASDAALFAVEGVHFNHETRPIESGFEGEASNADDQSLVTSICGTYGLPLTVFNWPTSSNTQFSQTEARNWRRGSLIKKAAAALNNSTAFILTSHHKGDNIESILINLMRGSHLKLQGMRAIAPAYSSPNLSPYSQSSSVYFVKPFLNTPKSCLLQYMTSNSLKWSEDPSNVQPKYKRNRVRSELVPLLQSISGDTSVGDRIVAWGETVAEASEYVDEGVDAFLREAIANKGYLKIDSLDLTTDGCLTYIQREGIHKYITSEGRRLLFAAASKRANDEKDKMDDVSNDFTLPQAIHFQIVDMLDCRRSNINWRIDVGQSLAVSRKGGGVFVYLIDYEEGEEKDDEDDTDEGDHRKTTTQSPCEWSLANDYADGERLYAIQNVANSKGGDRLHFSPPWSPTRNVKISAFLRGQNIAMEDRGLTPIIVGKRKELSSLKDEDERDGEILAVFIRGGDGGEEGRGWICKEGYSIVEVDNERRVKLVKL
jgi:tRNA(Ile)-lysidine synthetase-like protein